MELAYFRVQGRLDSREVLYEDLSWILNESVCRSYKKIDLFVHIEGIYQSTRKAQNDAKNRFLIVPTFTSTSNELMYISHTTKRPFSWKLCLRLFFPHVISWKSRLDRVPINLTHQLASKLVGNFHSPKKPTGPPHFGPPVFPGAHDARCIHEVVTTSPRRRKPSCFRQPERRAWHVLGNWKSLWRWRCLGLRVFWYPYHTIPWDWYIYIYLHENPIEIKNHSCNNKIYHYIHGWYGVSRWEDFFSIYFLGGGNFEDVSLSPWYLGKWSNLTSIFFRWVETTNL